MREVKRGRTVNQKKGKEEMTEGRDENFLIQISGSISRLR